MSRGTWDEPRIMNDSRIDDTNPLVRAAAERLHRNESIDKHVDIGGRVCIYCALRASTVVREIAQHRTPAS